MDVVTDSFSKFWNSLGEKPNSTIRFFDRQDYYTVHFEDAEMLARCHYKSLEILKYYRRESVSSPYINIGKNNSDTVFKYLLIVNQYKVEIYVNSHKSNDMQWKLDFVVTPGNLEKYQDLLFKEEVATTNSLLAINIKRINDDYKIYLGFCDLDNAVFMIGGFEESFTGYENLANLSSALFQLNCRECLIPSNDTRPELIAVKNTVQSAGLLITEVKKSHFVIENVRNNVDKLICKTKSNNEKTMLKLIDTEGSESIGCLGAVVAYLDLASDESFFNFFDVQAFKLDNYMRVGDQCSRALNILPSPNDLRKHDSLYGLLNCCRTSNGERLLMQWIKQPLMNVNLINNRLDAVETFVNDNKLRGSLYDDILRRIPDLSRIIRRIQRNKGNLQDIYKLYMSLNQASEISILLAEHEGPYKCIIQSEFSSTIQEILKSTENFVEMFKSFFDFEAVKNHEFKVKADVDENLKECETEMNTIRSQMEREYSKVADKLGFESTKQVKFESSNSLGYYMRVSRKDENVLRNKTFITIIETLKDGVKFHSPQMAMMNESYLQHRQDFEGYEKSIIEEIMKITNEYIAPLHELGSIIAKLDVICSLAVTVSGAPGTYVRPKLVEEDRRIFKAKNCRHPLVEMQSNISYIPNDIFFDESQSFHIITGPNMGGKSTYIRSMGLISVMAQIGSFVPCDEIEISIFDRIMTRIGAGDCQLTGVSTFMAEMLDISWILKTATPKSLIIIDELGRGTSTFDGFGLAWAISEHIATELKAFSVFATHFHELTDLTKIHGNVKNLHVSAETIKNELIFLYKVEEGASMKSYGIEVAKSSGLPDEAIELAKIKLAEYENLMEWDCSNSNKLEENRKSLIEFCDKNLDENVNLLDFVKELRENLNV